MQYAADDLSPRERADQLVLATIGDGSTQPRLADQPDEVSVTVHDRKRRKGSGGDPLQRDCGRLAFIYRRWFPGHRLGHAQLIEDVQNRSLGQERHSSVWGDTSSIGCARSRSRYPK